MDKLKTMTKTQKIQGLIILALLLCLLILPPVIGLKTSQWSILITVLLYMYYASSWNFMGGYTLQTAPSWLRATLTASST